MIDPILLNVDKIGVRANKVHESKQTRRKPLRNTFNKSVEQVPYIRIRLQKL